MPEATYAATLMYDCDPDTVRVFVRATPEAAVAAATAALLATTAEYRNTDVHPDDDEWVEVCLFEGWDMAHGLVE